MKCLCLLKAVGIEFVCHLVGITVYTGKDNVQEDKRQLFLVTQTQSLSLNPAKPLESYGISSSVPVQRGSGVLLTEGTP